MEIGQICEGTLRILAIRRSGRIVFMDARFQEDVLQVVFEANELDNFQEVGRLLPGDLIKIAGAVRLTRTREKSVFVSSFEVVARNLTSSRPENCSNRLFRYENRHVDLSFNMDSFSFWKAQADLYENMRSLLKADRYREFNTGILQEVRDGGLADSFTTICSANRKTYALSLTSEFKLKRLIAGGFNRVYELSQSFRNEGMNKDHSPEFSLLEAYSSVDTLEQVESLIEAVIAAGMTQNHEFTKHSFSDVWNQLFESDISLGTLCERYPGLFKMDMAGFTWVYKFILKILAPLFTEPTFIFGLPREFAILAEPLDDEEKNVKCGILVAKGLHIATYSRDLNDYEKTKLILERQYVECGVPVNIGFLDLLKFGLPPTTGFGIGVNRVAMLGLGTLPRDIKETILYPLR